MEEARSPAIRLTLELIPPPTRVFGGIGILRGRDRCALSISDSGSFRCSDEMEGMEGRQSR